MKDAKPESEIVPLDSLPARQFEVTHDNSANWVVRKIVEAEHYARRVKEWAEREIKCSQVEATFFRQRFGLQLEAWARQQLAHARRKCVKLPAGTVGFRTEPAKLNVTDEQKLVAWCRRSLPDALEDRNPRAEGNRQGSRQSNRRAARWNEPHRWRAAVLHQIKIVEGVAYAVVEEERCKLKAIRHGKVDAASSRAARSCCRRSAADARRTASM